MQTEPTAQLSKQKAIRAFNEICKHYKIDHAELASYWTHDQDAYIEITTNNFTRLNQHYFNAKNFLGVNSYHTTVWYSLYAIYKWQSGPIFTISFKLDTI